MLTREDKIEDSVMKTVADALPAFNYIEGDNVHVREAFPTPQERAQELTITTLAMGFQFDDGGRALEMGSDFYRFDHTIEWWVFATSPDIGKNLAAVVRHIMLSPGVIPIQDFSQDGAPEEGYLTVYRSARGRQIAVQPRPWDENVWTVTSRAWDDHNLSDL